MVTIMIGRLLLILIISLIISCKDRTSDLLPKKYDINQKQELGCFPIRIIIYDVSTEQFRTTDIIDYPKYVEDNCKLQKWINFNNLNEADKNYIVEVIKQEIDIENITHNSNIKLGNIFDKSSPIYFSGTYQKAKAIGNHTYNFYNTFNILNINKKKLYRFEYIPGY